MKPDSCSGCVLEKTGKGWVPLEWSPAHFSGVLIVGEAAGASEAADGLPFRPYAQAGALLADALRDCNIMRREVAIANCISCHPPKDWLVGSPWEYASLNQCVNTHLRAFIEKVRPKVILAMGGVALAQLTARPKGKSGTLEYIRGYALPGAGVAEGIPVIGTFHTAFLRRGASHLTPLLQRDLRRAFLMATGKLVQGQHYILDPLQNGGDYQTMPSVEEAWDWFNNIDPNRSIYADIETPRSRREDEDDRNSFADRDINLIQFTQRRGEGIALPWRDDYADIAREILSTPNRKVGHNWFGFDLPVLASNNVEIGGEQDDTMLQFHHYQPDLPQNLQAVAQYCGFPFAWKHLADSEPELYGCIDVDATCWADETMTSLLQRDGLAPSYARYVRTFWPILRDMSTRGIPISEEKRVALKEVIVEEGVRADASIKAIVPAEVLAQKQKFGYKNPPILTCETCGYKGRTDHFCFGGGYVEEGDGGLVEVEKQLFLLPYKLLAEENGLVLREIMLEKEEKCRCTKKTRIACDVCGGSGIIPAGVSEFRWAALTEFNPNSSHQVKRYMRFRKHPVPKHGKRTDSLTGDAAETTEVKELERLFAKTRDPIYPLLIEKRQLTKIEGTYVEGWAPAKDGRIRTTFTMKPATWQLSSREPNVQNGLKHADPDKQPFKYRLAKSFNAMQAAEDGHLMVNFDFKSFHAQTLACEAGDPDYLRLAKIDVHSFVSCHFLRNSERHNLLAMSDADLRGFFKELKRDKAFKFVRDFKAKRAILGLGFGMGARKLYQMNLEDFESEAEAKKLMALILEELFPKLKRYQVEVRRLAAEQRYLQNLFGGIRRFYDVERWSRKDQKFIGGDQAEAAVAFLPASSAFGHIRDVMHRIRARGWDDKYQLVNSIHDSLVFHCPVGVVEECVANITAEMSAPSRVLIYPKCAPHGLSVEAEASVGPNLAEMSEFQLEKVFA